MDIKERQKSAQKHRINWLDIGIFVIAIALIVFLIVKYFSGGDVIQSASGKEVIIEYTVQIEKLSTDLTLSLDSGSAVVDMDSKVNLGKLAANAMFSAYQENVYNEQSGGIEVVNSDKYVTAYITIIAEATENDYGFYVNNTRIAVESMLNLRIEGLEAQGKCIGLEVKAEN